jgi:hypothetical protein
LFAEFEHATIVERVTSGIERRAKEGKWATGRLPFGYLWVPETQFGLLCSALTGSRDGHLVSVLAVATPARIGRVALPVGGCERGRDPCLAARVDRASPAGWTAELPAG